ncbi:hypothetical protein JCM33374_g1992 [Metschnikowia sp. JCM 33374]|nr:hypothetical protein JCM33374_g1992 [Metschnikowia sp. JCM 33374]
MSANKAQSNNPPQKVSLNDENLAVGARSTPTEFRVIVPEHEYHVNHPNGSATRELKPPAHACAKLSQQPLIADTVVQLANVQNGFYSNSKDAIHISASWYGGALPPITSWGSSDHRAKTSTTAPVHSLEALPSPPTISPNLLIAGSFQSPTANYTPSLTATSTCPPFRPSSKDVPSFMPEKDSHHPLGDSLKPHSTVSDSSTPLHAVPFNVKLSMNHAGSASQQETAPLVKLVADSVAHAESSEDANKAFHRLVPLLKTVHSRNLGSFLVKMLKECRHHLPLDEFYLVIYSKDAPKEITIPRGEQPGMADGVSLERLTEIKLHYLIRESFRIPQAFHNGVFQQSMLRTVDFHDFLRTVLAMKILFCCVKKVDDPSQTLPRLAIYKVYYIIFQKLFLKYPEISNSIRVPQKYILGQPKIGKVTKLIYPDLGRKRLGKRGESKVHYIGVTWNEAIVDHDTLRLLDLGVTDLSDYFASRAIPPKRTPVTRPLEKQNSQHIFTQQLPPIPMPSPSKPLLSFVDFSSKYPDWECSPRVWKLTPNSAPKQSEWARSTMKRSLEVLKRHGVNLDPLITKLNTGNFADDQCSISGTLLQSVNVLRDSFSSKETYLHLYLAVMLLLLPVIIASDQEVPKFSKAQLRASMKECALKLENEFAVLPGTDSISVTTFAGVLRKMIHINEMTSSRVKVSTEVVFKEMIHNVKSLTTTVDHIRNISAFEELFIKGATAAMHAYSDDPFCKRSATNGTASVANIHHIGKSFQDVVLIATRAVSPVSLEDKEGGTPKDVPHQLFHLSAKLFHQVTLSYPEIRHLPIRKITFIISYFLNEMQQTSFAEFSRRDPDLSRDTFKSWWVFSSMFQEYMGVMSEVVALSHILV